MDGRKKPKDLDSIIKELKETGYPESCVVGEVIERKDRSVFVR